MHADEVIERLGLIPHPAEGGFFREVYRAGEAVVGEALATRYGGPRDVSTAIYYLLTLGTCSAMHRLASDEVFHFYLGDPVEQLQLFPDGAGRVVTLGVDLAAGQRPLMVVSRGLWQGAALVPGGEHGFALLGTTVAPGFDFADYEDGERAALVAAYPEFAERIAALTPASA